MEKAASVTASQQRLDYLASQRPHLSLKTLDLFQDHMSYKGKRRKECKLFLPESMVLL